MNRIGPPRQIEKVQFSSNTPLKYTAHGISAQVDGGPRISIASIGRIDQFTQRGFPSNQPSPRKVFPNSTELTSVDLFSMRAPDSAIWHLDSTGP
ncbi:hypothetical protein ACWEJP_10870 [Streptomyces sp. NPDC004749]